MFGKNKKQKSARISTVIGDETEVHGDIIFTGGLHVDGVIKGNVTAQSKTDAVLTISENGVIEGEVKVPNVILNGKVSGDVYSIGHLELAPKAEVTGTVYYNLLEMSMGASVNGNMVHNVEQEQAVVGLEKEVQEMEESENRIKLD
jgi:cytoskeletal protein CcmA (bactofilin family)